MAYDAKNLKRWSQVGVLKRAKTDLSREGVTWLPGKPELLVDSTSQIYQAYSNKDIIVESLNESSQFQDIQKSIKAFKKLQFVIRQQQAMCVVRKRKMEFKEEKMRGGSFMGKGDGEKPSDCGEGKGRIERHVVFEKGLRSDSNSDDKMSLSHRLILDIETLIARGEKISSSNGQS